MAANASDRITFDVLNGLRGVAAIAVVNAHMSAYFAGYGSPSVGLAVDFFFMLSGFVVAHAYEGKLNDGFGSWRFIAARLIRLYPTYLVGTVFGAAVCWFVWNFGSTANFIVSTATSVALVPPPTPYSSNGWNLLPFDPPAWSLMFEVVVNILYAFVARYLSNRVLGIVIAVSFVALAIFGYLAGTTDLGVRPEQFGGGLARVLFSFFAGVALHRLWQRRPVRFSAHPVVLFGLLVLPLLFPTGGKLVWAYDLAIIAFYFPLLLSVGAQSKGGSFWTFICAALGAASYPLYILHFPVFEVLKGTVPDAMLAAAPWSGIGLLLALLALSWSAETFVELPLRRKLNRRVLKRPTGGHPSGFSTAEQVSALTR